MRPVVGVDVGATLCKVAPLDTPAAGVHFPSSDLARVRDHLAAARPGRTGLTGGGAPGLAALLGDVPLVHVGEFQAWAAGAPLVATAEGVTLPERHLLVSVGTGTSILALGRGAPERVGGTAVGGGTLLGLGRLLLEEASFERIAALAVAGDRRHVDLLVGDVYRDQAGPLLADLTAANFGKLHSTRREDLAAALTALVGETVALMAAALARATGLETVVYCGSTLTGNPALQETIRDITRRFGASPLFLARGAFAGAVGAAAVAARS
jgi:type II pantothenate kinase